MRIVKLICLLLLTGCVLGVGLRGAYRGRELQRRMICASNLNSIATMAKIYAIEWDGMTPVLDWLVKSALIDPKLAKCPCADGPNYVVVTARLVAGIANLPLDDRMIVAYEPKSNHDGEGGSMVFADGHASFVPVPAYDELLSPVGGTDP